MFRRRRDKGRLKHTRQPQPHATQQQINTDFVEFPPERELKSQSTKRYLAVKRPQVTGVERTGPVLFCAACGCVTANHSSDNSQRGLLTELWTARSSRIKKNGETN